MDESVFFPLLLDQTQAGSTQALVAAVPYAGRALPLACYTFDYPLQEASFDSQNQLEHIFIIDTEQSMPPGAIPVWIGDRGFARALFLAQSAKEGRAYILRGRGNTGITYQNRRMKLKDLPGQAGKAIRYGEVRYHAKQQVIVDVVVYWETGFAEPWYLLTPPQLRTVLTDDLVVSLYRERMQIEQSFRDFKTHLGLRGLKLEVSVAQRMGRLLLSFLLAYILCVLLGETELGQKARFVFETPRHKPRHGTGKILSALGIAAQMLAHELFREKAYRRLFRIISAMADKLLFSVTNLDSIFIKYPT